MLEVQRDPLGLSEGSLIPIQTDPPHSIENSCDRFIRRPALVRVLDTEDKSTLLLPCEEPIEERRPHSAYMKKPRRARGKTNAYLGHGGNLDSGGRLDDLAFPMMGALSITRCPADVQDVGFLFPCPIVCEF